jgi:folate-dependent phosphoribosylglycinamide formyltransferase PurN
MPVNTALGRPLRVGVLCSERAPGLVHLLNHDPHRGSEYEIVCCLTSGDTFAEEVRVERRGVPCLSHSIHHFCRTHGAEIDNLAARVAFDRAMLQQLAPYNPDVLLLDGYYLLLTDPVLEQFEGRIVDLHASDITLRNGSGGPRYPGLHAVRDAFLAGEPETRVSAHVVTTRLDDGPVLLRSWSFPAPPVVSWARARGALDVLRAAAWVHHEWMLREAWGPMMMRTLELAALAVEQPGRPLVPARVGRWALAPDGSLTPDGAMVTSG